MVPHIDSIPRRQSILLTGHTTRQVLPKRHGITCLFRRLGLRSAVAPSLAHPQVRSCGVLQSGGLRTLLAALRHGPPQSVAVETRLLAKAGSAATLCKCRLPIPPCLRASYRHSGPEVMWFIAVGAELILLTVSLTISSSASFPHASAETVCHPMRWALVLLLMPFARCHGSLNCPALACHALPPAANVSTN